MKFIFLMDYKEKLRFFSSLPVENIHIEFSRWKKLWEVAKTRLMLLPTRLLSQEQAFEKVLKLEAPELKIFHSGLRSEKRIRTKFFFFIQKQRSKHVLMIIGEILLLPISGLMALLPGPNVFFGFLALILYTHWMGLRGINRLAKINCRFSADDTLKLWENAVKNRMEAEYPEILAKMGEAFGRKNIAKILWK